MSESELRKKWEKKICELKNSGNFVDAIEFGPDGEFIGMVYELNLDFDDPELQKNFPKSVEYWKD